MKRIRSLSLIAAVVLATTPCVALAQSAPIQVKDLGSFAIKPSDLPTGCTLISTYDSKHDDMLPTITCDTQEQFETGFVFTNDKLVKTCDTVKGKYVCKVTKS
jgi:hypothetical protein